MTFLTAKREQAPPIIPPSFSPGSDLPSWEHELEIVARLHSLAQVSWSPTLRANSHLLKRRLLELQRHKVATEVPRP